MLAEFRRRDYLPSAHLTCGVRDFWVVAVGLLFCSMFFQIVCFPLYMLQELIQYFRKNQVDTDQGMIQRVKGMSVEEALITIRQKILQRFRGNEASTRAAFRLFDKDGGGEVSVRSLLMICSVVRPLTFFGTCAGI